MCVLSEIACTATVSEEGGCGWLRHRKEVPVLWSEGTSRIRTAALVQMGPAEECMWVHRGPPKLCCYEWLRQMTSLTPQSPPQKKSESVR